MHQKYLSDYVFIWQQQHANLITSHLVKNTECCIHCECRPAAEIAANLNTIIWFKDPPIKVILCAVPLSLVSSNCRLMGEMIFLGTSLGHRSIPVPSESNDLAAAAAALMDVLLCSAWASVALMNGVDILQLLFSGRRTLKVKASPERRVITSLSATRGHI